MARTRKCPYYITIPSSIDPTCSQFAVNLETSWSISIWTVSMEWTNWVWKIVSPHYTNHKLTDNIFRTNSNICRYDESPDEILVAFDIEHGCFDVPVFSWDICYLRRGCDSHSTHTIQDNRIEFEMIVHHFGQTTFHKIRTEFNCLYTYKIESRQRAVCNDKIGFELQSFHFMEFIFHCILQFNRVLINSKL